MFEKIWKYFSNKSKTGLPDVEKYPDTPPVKSPRNKNLSSGSFGWGMLTDLFDGEKYPGGLNSDLGFFNIDYWTLRRRSYKLFTENRYAAGLIKRMLTNEVHRGRTLEATPKGEILGKDDDVINDWTDDTEAKFDIWSDNKELVSHNHQFVFGQLQHNIRKTCILSGDAVIILRQHPVTKTPTVQIVDGFFVRTPLKPETKNEVRHGVELDKKGRHVAYYIQDMSDPTGLKSKRIPARGPKSGRRIAWMVYGNKIRIDDARGMPLLGIMLQALKELDRYSDAEQRAAVLNAIQAYFIKKGQDKAGTRPISGGAVRRDKVSADTDSGDTQTRSFNISSQMPGSILEELQHGEEPVSFNTVRPNVNYRAFEEAMMASFAWANEMPPNIYRLAFSSNYSASTGEVNEYKLYLDKARWKEANNFDKPFYKEWLISMVLTGLISAPGLLEAWRDPKQFLISGAWFSSEWSAAIKPSMRLNQDIKGWIEAIKQGLATRDMATKALFGAKFTTVVKRLKKENSQYAATMEPLMDAGLLKDESSNNTATISDNLSGEENAG